MAPDLYALNTRLTVIAHISEFSSTIQVITNYFDADKQHVRYFLT